jgi:predicted kinase
VILVGLPGSGKSTWCRARQWPVLSSDEVRRLLADDPEDQSFPARVFATLRNLLRQRLELRRPLTVVDATHLTPRERRPYIQLARLYDCEVEAVFFDVPVSVCQERNAARARVVPPEVILRMAERLVPPAVEEGFDRVTRVSGTE